MGAENTNSYSEIFKVIEFTNTEVSTRVFSFFLFLCGSPSHPQTRTQAGFQGAHAVPPLSHRSVSVAEESFPAPHTLFTSSLFFWPETWEKVWNLSHPYTFSFFNSGQELCCEAKPGSERGILEGLKCSGGASLQDTDKTNFPWCLSQETPTVLSSSRQLFFFSFFFLGYTSGFSCIKMDVLHTQVRCSDVIIRPGWRRFWNSACFILFLLLYYYKRKKIIMCSKCWWQSVKLWRNVL